MRLVVGLDLTRRSEGAIRFAAWLRTQVEPTEHKLSGAYVLVPPEDALVVQMAVRSRAEVRRLAQLAVTAGRQNLRPLQR